jgi:hypothetical protein
LHLLDPLLKFFNYFFSRFLAVSHQTVFKIDRRVKNVTQSLLRWKKSTQVQKHFSSLVESSRRKQATAAAASERRRRRGMQMEK